MYLAPAFTAKSRTEFRSKKTPMPLWLTGIVDVFTLAILIGHAYYLTAGAYVISIVCLLVIYGNLHRGIYFMQGRRWPEDVFLVMQPSLECLDTVMAMSAPYIKKIERWNLDDPGLLVILGYISGFIDAAYQATQPRKYEEQFIGELFTDAVARYLSDIPDTEKYLEIQQTIGRNRTIAGLQYDPRFIAGALAGGGDFVSLVNDKKAPLSLAKLLMPGD